MAEFILHPRLVRATAPIADLDLSRVLLIDAKDYPWLLLVPRRPEVEEIYQLDAPDRATLIEEIAAVSEVIRDLFEPFRINVSDIGNRAEQLHIHVVGRQQDDPAWPSVVWSRPYDPWPNDRARQERRGLFLRALQERGPVTPLAAHTDPSA